MKRLGLLLALFLLSGCMSLTSSTPFTGKYFTETPAERSLIGKGELTYSFAYNLYVVHKEDFPLLLAWTDCEYEAAGKEVAYRRNLIQARYNRPDAWMGSGQPSYIRVAQLEITGFEEEQRKIKFMATNARLPFSGQCKERETLAKQFDDNYSAGKYYWRQYVNPNYDSLGWRILNSGSKN